jgi:hypothetical protein
MSGHQGPGGLISGRTGPGRIALYLVLLVLGAVVGVAGSLVQGGWFPGGLVLALLATGALFLAGSQLAGNQLGIGAAAAGWLISVIFLSVGRPEGDGIFAAGIGPLVYLLGGMVIAVICATVWRLPQPARKSG